MSTIADAEVLGVSLAWETNDVVALDSKGVIQRIQGLVQQKPRSCIEERLARQVNERPRTLGAFIVVLSRVLSVSHSVSFRSFLRGTWLFLSRPSREALVKVKCVIARLRGNWNQCRHHDWA